MSAAIIAQLVIALGPTALELIPRLAAIWHKPDLSSDEVEALCRPAKKSYDDYLNESRKRIAALTPLHATHTGDG